MIGSHFEPDDMSERSMDSFSFPAVRRIGCGAIHIVSVHAPMDKAFSDWRNRYANEPFLYSFDPQGYGTNNFSANRINWMSGFREKVFDRNPLLKTDRTALVNRIEAVPL